jgi:dTDP-4-amino-4,6-dideoxygalactose transaminase
MNIFKKMETMLNKKFEAGDLTFGAPDFTEAEINAVSRVMRSGWVVMGQGDSTGEESAFRSVDL